MVGGLRVTSKNHLQKLMNKKYDVAYSKIPKRQENLASDYLIPMAARTRRI